MIDPPKNIMCKLQSIHFDTSQWSVGNIKTWISFKYSIILAELSKMPNVSGKGKLIKVYSVYWEQDNWRKFWIYVKKKRGKN